MSSVLSGDDSHIDSIIGIAVSMRRGGSRSWQLATQLPAGPVVALRISRWSGAKVTLLLQDLQRRAVNQGILISALQLRYQANREKYENKRYKVR